MGTAVAPSHQIANRPGRVSRDRPLPTPTEVPGPTPRSASTLATARVVRRSSAKSRVPSAADAAVAVGVWVAHRAIAVHTWFAPGLSSLIADKSEMLIP